MVNTCLNIRWYVAYKQQLHGDGKVNTGVTTKLSKIKSCNRIVKEVWFWLIIYGFF
jgi:hypothetical protein